MKHIRCANGCWSCTTKTYMRSNTISIPVIICGYDYVRDGRVGRGYAEKIWQCRVGFADSVFPFAYIVAKFFEIPATGALLLADDTVSEPLSKLGFVAGRALRAGIAK